MMRAATALLAGALLLGSCSQSSGTSGSGAAAPYKVTMAIMITGALPDISLIQAAINDRIRDKGLELEILPLSYSALTDQVNLMIAGGEKLDLIPRFSNQLITDVTQGKLLPITQYLKTTGTDIARVVGADYLKAGTIGGEIYGIPSIRDMAASYGMCFRKDLLDKYGFKVEDIKTTADVSRVYETVSKGEPGMYMTYSQGNFAGIVSQLLVEWDSLGDSYGVLMNHGQDAQLKVVNLYETPEYAQKLRIVRDWYQKGYVIPDAATNSQAGTVLVGAGQLFSFAANLKPGFDKQSTLGAGGVEMVTATISPALSTTGQVAILSWSIPITSKNPEKTVEFLSLMYTDPVIVNLLDWGIEGKHYAKLNGNVITYPAGVDASNTGYNFNLAWTIGNSLLAYAWEGNDLDINDQMQAFNRSAIISKALGFQFDATPVRNAVTAVANVTAEYTLSLEFGMVDVDSTLPRFQRALKDAGIDEIVAEKQRQLDAWLAGN
jgi:putative aldouronate transport system substrate-binding protein